MKTKVTQAELNRLSNKIADDVLQRAMILFCAGARDELELDDARLSAVIERVDRYAGHVSDHLVSLGEVKAILEKTTGMQFLGF